jgi:hypothetical protein
MKLIDGFCMASDAGVVGYLIPALSIGAIDVYPKQHFLSIKDKGYPSCRTRGYRVSSVSLG